MGSSPSIEAAKLDAFFAERLEKARLHRWPKTVCYRGALCDGPARNGFGSLARELGGRWAPRRHRLRRAPQETVALQAATHTIPIVFMQTGKPRGVGSCRVAGPAGRQHPPGSAKCRRMVDSKTVGSCCTMIRARGLSCRVQPFLGNPQYHRWICGFADARGRRAKSLGHRLAGRRRPPTTPGRG